VGTIQTIGVVLGLIIIAVVGWNIASRGIARSNGEAESYGPDRNNEWHGDGF
jgi:hypothetical protein